MSTTITQTTNSELPLASGISPYMFTSNGLPIPPTNSLNATMPLITNSANIVTSTPTQMIDATPSSLPIPKSSTGPNSTYVLSTNTNQSAKNYTTLISPAIPPTRATSSPMPMSTVTLTASNPATQTKVVRRGMVNPVSSTTSLIPAVRSAIRNRNPYSLFSTAPNTSSSTTPASPV